MLDFFYKNKKTISILFLGVLFIVVIFGAAGGYLNVSGIIIFLRSHKISAPLIFIIAYCVLMVSFIPTIPLNFAAGFLWGGWLGTILTLIGTSLGASLSFFISRYFARSYFEKFFNKGFWKFIGEKLIKNDWKAVAFTRINPAFPFGLTSYFFGLTKISFKKYLIFTIVCVAPMVTLFSFLGSFAEGVWEGSGAAYLLGELMPLLISATIIVIIFALFKNYKKFKKSEMDQFKSID
ncbi:MAG: TVP38/TMEM64 family protein [Candidatus Wolfebacteria bacterium]|nr:TVP38/TMEM64 family protein [Candidatus Wolfebacteria bacterium]